MTISAYIQQIASESLPDYSYQYNRNTDFNINGDNTVSPAVVCIEPDQGSLNLSSLTGNVGDGYNLFIRFIQTLPIDIAEQAPTRVQAIANQKAAAARFVEQLSQDDIFTDLTARIPLTYVIEAYDSNWVGVEINLQNLQTIYPFDICL